MKPATRATPDVPKAGEVKTPGKKRRGRDLLILLLIVVSFHLIACASVAWETIRAKHRDPAITPARFGLPFERVSFQSSDGTRLAGWYVPFAPRPKKTSQSNKEHRLSTSERQKSDSQNAMAKPPRGVLIFCHGVDSTKTAMLPKVALLRLHDYACLLFDFRARGESGGAHSTLGDRETDDLFAAVQYVKSRPDTRGLPIGVYGESMGGAVALMGTARSQEVQAVVAESPFARLDHAVTNNFRNALGWAAPLVGVPTRWFGERMTGKSCSDIAPILEISKIAPRQVLLIQDGADRLCPQEETAALMAQPGRGKTLWTVPRADHIAALETNPDDWERRVSAFFEENLR